MTEHEAAIRCAAAAAERICPPEAVGLIRFLRDMALEGAQLAQASQDAATRLALAFVAEENPLAAQGIPEVRGNGYSRHVDLWRADS